MNRLLIRKEENRYKIDVVDDNGTTLSTLPFNYKTGADVGEAVATLISMAEGSSEGRMLHAKRLTARLDNKTARPDQPWNKEGRWPDPLESEK